jgi:hemerythrin
MDDPAVNGKVILNFIKDWFISHVAGKDKMLGEYLYKLTNENKIIGV